MHNVGHVIIMQPGCVSRARKNSCQAIRRDPTARGSVIYGSTGLQKISHCHLSEIECSNQERLEGRNGAGIGSTKITVDYHQLRMYGIRAEVPGEMRPGRGHLSLIVELCFNYFV